MSLTDKYLAIVNPAAGGGACRKLLPPALARLRSGGIDVEVRETTASGHASKIASQAWREGRRKFISVGGDGTSFEIVNGLFPLAEREQPTLGFLPLGAGNSFLRDFSDRVAEYAIESLVQGRSRQCDVMRLRHRQGALHYINLLSVGFAADVATMRLRRFKAWGELGYLTSIFVCLARFRRRSFPLTADGEDRVDERPCLFLTFNNSKFTGGTMMIAPRAATDDGLIDFVRWGPISRLGLIRNLPGLYDGTHTQHPLAEVRKVRRVDFHLEGPVDVMVDGEVITLDCESLDVLPGALRIVA
ncbi:MAG: diacylglycerol kinase family lipid kinase [Acidobacteria bacterium]|nr:diacylglycerol kinase family lipid kinase [Acidobacteriota bacterium]